MVIRREAAGASVKEESRLSLMRVTFKHSDLKLLGLYLPKRQNNIVIVRLLLSGSSLSHM